ncbi:MAG: hypothetical protein ABIP54_02815 [Candidatus Andersenbacteria bacterium]
MRLRGVDFPSIMTASGTQGFFGEGYWYHGPWKLLGLTFKGCGFVAKTTTLLARPGNMPMKQDGITPREFFPKCIVVRPLKGVVLNAVGLSGPGTPALLERNIWQQRKGAPWFLSFMAPDGSDQEKLDQLKEFILLLNIYKIKEWNARIGLELNLSCPNTGTDLSNLVQLAGQMLDIVTPFGIPIQIKINATIPPEIAKQIMLHRACDAIVCSNTIPWGKLPDKINWKKLFGSETSPLDHLGSGGLSGWPLREIVFEWIRNIRDCGMTKPIWTCGGIDSPEAVYKAFDAHASGIQVGTVAMLRPWRMKSIIRAVRELRPGST